MTTDGEQENDAMDILTRREVLSGGSVALLGAMGLSGTASAQTGTEPRIQLGADWEIDDYDDGSGNNNLRIRHQPSGAELVYNVTSNQWEPSDGFSTPKLEVTNETLISIEQTTDQSLNAGTFATLNFDNVVEDELGEFDISSDRLTPDETGWYWIALQVVFNVGSSGDTLNARFRNIDAGSNEMQALTQAASSAPEAISLLRCVNLTAGTNYELQVRNANSSDNTVGTPDQTFITVRRAWR